MNRDDIERLVRVETGLTEVRTDLTDHRTESQRKHEELLQQIVLIGAKIDASKFPWSRVLSPDTFKLCAYVVLSLAGLSAAATNLFSK